MKLNLNKILIITGVVAFTLIIVFFVWWRNGGEIDIVNESGGGEIEFPKSSISGVSCGNYNRRPLAVMLSSDVETRPLSGISEADIVFEMPVTPNKITRTMAVYQCGEPQEIGSIRSAREDFIPLAAGLKAIYVHWGGEREALNKLDNHIIDNIDAMKYETEYFYRKKGMPMPHNGFTDFEKILKAIGSFGYSLENEFSGYFHSGKEVPKNIANIVDSVVIDYPHPLNVQWSYDAKTNAYKRLRGGKSEIDKNNGRQVEANIVIIIKTDSKYINKDYVNIRVTGEGDAEIYQNGIKVSGKWKKDPARLDDKLFFYTAETRNGEEKKEIDFVPGKIWVEITTSD